MHIPPMRPTFQITFPYDTQEAVDRLSILLNDDDYPITGRIAGNHLMLVIPPKQRHFWSPWLHIEIENKDDQQDPSDDQAPDSDHFSLVRGRFSPNPSVWTGFMLTYIAIATLIFFASMFGIAQWMMDKPPSALKLIPLFALIAGALYWASLLGQRLALKQMHELYDVSMQSLKDDDAKEDQSSEIQDESTSTLSETENIS